MTWLLVVLWLSLNLLGISISWMFARLGAIEVGQPYWVSSFQVASTSRVILALMVAGLLVWVKRRRWLIWLNAVMLLLLCWSSLVLVQRMWEAEVTYW